MRLLRRRPTLGQMVGYCASILMVYASTAMGANGPLAEMDPAGYPTPNTGCLAPGKCHGGIEPIRAHNSVMAKQIYEKGAKLGDPNGCVVCHGGNPIEEKEAKIAHTGAPEGGSLDTFVLHSASVWVNEKICGQCHEPWVYAQYRSIMQTEAGKIQGALWGWGPASTGYEKKFGNYDVDDPDGPDPVFGTRALMKAYPYNFPSNLKQVPKTNLELLPENPYEAVYTYSEPIASVATSASRAVTNAGTSAAWAAPLAISRTTTPGNTKAAIRPLNVMKPAMRWFTPTVNAENQGGGKQSGLLGHTP